MVTDIRPGDEWAGDAYCVKCKEKRQLFTVVSVVQMRLMAKGYCSYCGTKLNRILGNWEGPGGMGGKLFKSPERLPVIVCPSSSPHPGHRYVLTSQTGEAWCDGLGYDGEPWDGPYTPSEYATAVEWHQKDAERLSGLIMDDPGPVDLGRVLGMTPGQVNRLGLPENVTVTFTRNPPPGVMDIAKAYDGCDNPRCSLCKNPGPM